MQLFLVISLYLIKSALSHSSCAARNYASSDVSFNHYGMCVFQDNLQGAVFLREGSSGLEYRVQVKGLSHGYHGFHVHTYGSVYRADVGEGRCVASGGHYDPLSATHGNINDTNRHVGDLGNICANEDGEAVDVFVDSDSSLTGTNPIRGRAIVIHAGPDDFTSQPSGDSGSRVGCCIIGQSQSWIPSEISFGYTDSSISIVRSQVVEMAMVGVFLIVLKFMV